MRRTPLARTNPLRRGAAPTRRKPLPRSNPRRRAQLRKLQYGDHAAWLRTLPCVLCGRHPSVAAHAAKTRGAGGRAEHCINLCIQHERLFHQKGRSWFEREFSIDLRATAAELWFCSPARSRDA